eukprot:3694648-Rhodomonas_salina.1
MAVANKMKIHHLDVVTAFLYQLLIKELHMEVPEDITTEYHGLASWSDSCVQSLARSRYMSATRHLTMTMGRNLPFRFVFSRRLTNGGRSVWVV